MGVEIDKIALGRKGEIFVMQRILEHGWKFPENYHLNLDGLDWVFQKANRNIRVQVKCSERKYPAMNCSTLNFDYLIFTNLKECYIMPIEIISVGKARLTKAFKKLKNKFDLLDLSGKDLLSALIDYGIKPNLWMNTGKIFFPKSVEDKSLKLPVAIHT